MTGIIYALISKISKEPFYVGCTQYSAAFRLQAHISKSKRGSERVYQYIRAYNIDFDIEVLQKISFTDNEQLLKAELKWIKRLMRQGFLLQNGNKTKATSKVRGNAYGHNVRIPTKEHDIIKDYIKSHPKYNMGGFMAEATIEKIQKETNDSKENH